MSGCEARDFQSVEMHDGGRFALDEATFFSEYELFLVVARKKGAKKLVAVRRRRVGRFRRSKGRELAEELDEEFEKLRESVLRCAR